MKKCRKCGEIKPEAEFYKAKTTKDGLAGECKRCASNMSREYYRSHNPAKILTEKQHRVLQFIDELYKQHGKFPSYGELAEKTGTTRQDVDGCLNFVLKKAM
jgi:DNA-directed RNA polymerase specialized sigma subunit